MYKFPLETFSTKSPDVFLFGKAHPVYPKKCTSPMKFHEVIPTMMFFFQNVSPLKRDYVMDMFGYLCENFRGVDTTACFDA